MAQTDISPGNILPTFIIDVTTPLNALMSQALSEIDFITRINLLPMLRRNNSKPPDISLLYSTECVYLNFENCTTEIESVSNLVNSTLGSVNLTISFTIDPYNAILFTSDYNGTKIQIPDFPNNIVFNLREDTMCHHLKQMKVDSTDIMLNFEKWISFNPNSNKNLGFGYGEALIDCQYRAMSMSVLSASFNIWNMRFGYTDGVTESFGLFKRRMNFLHNEHIKFLESRDVRFNTANTMSLVYYADSESVGDESHRRLLIEFSEMWVASQIREKYKISVVIQPPYFEEPISQTEFSVITGVNSLNCAASSSIDAPFQDLRWYSPAALSTLSKYFDSLLLTLDDWRALNSEKAQQLYGKPYLPTKYLNETSIILMFTGSIYPDLNDTCRKDWKSIENELAIRQLESHKYAVPTTLIFEVTKPTAQEFVLAVDFDFVHRISSSYTMGCWFDLLSTRIDTTLLVETCKSIGSSVYILRYLMWREPPHGIYRSKIDYLYFENEIRTYLEEVNTVRLRILREHSEAIVYLNLRGISTWLLHLNQQYPVTVFCNPMVQDFNLYFEAILNWAKLKNFPLVLKPAFDGLYTPAAANWLLLLRPLQSNMRGLTEISSLHPSFVLRNYPEGINNWTVDPCVEWNQFIPDVLPDYFHNYYIGAVLEFDVFPSNEQTVSSFEIMLQFVLNRFNSVEIQSGSMRKTIVKVLHNLKSHRLVDDQKRIFICYQFEEFYSYLEAVHEIKKQNLQFVKGIHLDLSASSIKNIIGFSKNLESMQNPKTETSMGVVLQCSFCMNLIHFFVYGSPAELNNEISQILNTVNYMVCTERVNGISLTNQSILGGLFDTHLYIKRAYQEFKPSLNVYFRVEVNTELDSTKATMEPYLLALSRFREFGTAYGINYFLVNCFDNENGINQNGWWGIQNFTLLNDPQSYIEKESG
ncbi:unnamed protein product [Orchesella dallaii]|uniref:Uncharacterized protein n=1 Tax=Orchesella dallaii TaxID=48710 RepID=A0ABP1RP48_9HEXA